MATQAASSVAITGGTITGITDLAVADGGTGASTAPAARVNLGAIGNLLSKQDFTASGTWTKPSNCKYIVVEGVGGGGGGAGVAGNSTDSAGGGGGGAGAYGITGVVDVTSITSATITIPNAAAGGTAGANAGAAGGNVTWTDGTNSWTWGGGAGGQAQTAATSPAVLTSAAPGEVSGTGLIGGGGSQGGPSVRMAGGGTCRGGVGGSSPFGTGGASPANNTAGNAGSGYGAGGSGATANASTGAGGLAGGAGTKGFIRVWEYY